MIQRVRVKFCGLTRIADIKAAVAAGVDALGFVLWPQSPRAINLTKLAQLVTAVPPFVCRVGLFVNSPAELVAQAAPLLDVLQFHGQESAEECACFGLPWIKALALTSQKDLQQFMQQYQQASAFLFDAPAQQWPGGNGQTFDWQLLTDLSITKPWILAGGLTPQNIPQALELLTPYAVDVSSGIESAPGYKDAELIQHVMQVVTQMNELHCKNSC